MIPFSDEELLNPVKNSLEKVRPILLADGGDMELIKIENAVVYIKLVGHCKGCAASDATLKNGIEKQLKIDIHPDMKVVNLKD